VDVTKCSLSIILEPYPSHPLSDIVGRAMSGALTECVVRVWSSEQF
jgi:hypothetical protein